MDVKNQNKKTYQKPLLLVHGNVEKITQFYQDSFNDDFESEHRRRYRRRHRRNHNCSGF